MSNIFEQSSFLFGSNSYFIEELYQLYLQNPNSVDPSWKAFFDEHAGEKIISAPTWVKNGPRVILGEEKTETVKLPQAAPNNSLATTLKAKFMIDSYRARGHYLAKIDPLGMEVLPTKEEVGLNLESFGFGNNDLETEIDLHAEFLGMEKITLGRLVSILDQSYAESIAVELGHVENLQEQAWLFERIERDHLGGSFSAEEQKISLKKLVEVEGFEQYLHTKFPGAKRFSIEGGDSSIVAFRAAIERAADSGVEDVVIGMAHRGRLCTLTQVMEKPYRAMLSEFMGTSAFPDDLDVAGDVKYHMGYSSDRVTAKGNKVHLSLTPNPSHLEAVNPVVAGKVRAKQDLMGDKERRKVMGFLIHGDAAFCGQGVVAECLVMSGLAPYQVGGILHFVINNQVGFTANSGDTRPGRYATEVAKMVGAPIFHVNGDDIEAVLIATNIAVDYRKEFGKDAVIDIVCYRKYGHNEGDEPMYTQGPMYNIIKNKKTPGNIYADKLLGAGIIDNSYYNGLKESFKLLLDKEYEEAKNYKPKAQWLEGAWAGFARSGDSDKNPETGVDKKRLQELGLKLCDIPKSFSINSKLTKLFQNRAESLQSDKPIDWATGEQLAFATLLTENIPVRLTGQDCGRGTFSHRHSVLHSQVDKGVYEPLNNLGSPKARYEVADSHLSEYGVLGFEYGYSLVNPQQLVMWEAQFGDFANGAQIMFDQFIASSETKWLRLSGLVVMLPHGYEGQGPEHSSARLERFLQLAADDNIQVLYPTTPASIFHLLRRQIHRNIRKPAIVMTPKSLLRHKLAVSALDEISSGTNFSPIIGEVDSTISPGQVKRVIFCTGKVYYDLLEKRIEKNIKDTAIIRFEQLYPLQAEAIAEIMKKYSSAKEWIWCQEEPKNMGAWSFISSYLMEAAKASGLDGNVNYVGREAAASPATGYLYLHNAQQAKLVKQALNIGD